jgi:hypothetical protein
MPSSFVADRWYEINCDNGKGIANATKITVKGFTDNRPIAICGIIVKGYQSQNPQTANPKVVLSLSVDRTGKPYVVNTERNIFWYDSTGPTWHQIAGSATTVAASD